MQHHHDMRSLRGGATAWRVIIFKSVYHACSWQSETSQLSITVRNEATMGAFQGMIIFMRSDAYALSYRREAPRCSFYCDGQCEGLRLQNGQPIQTLTLFHSKKHSNADEKGTEANIVRYESNTTQNCARHARPALVAVRA